MNSHKFCW